VFGQADALKLSHRLSQSSPYKEAPTESLKLLGFVDDRLRPLPLLSGIWGNTAKSSQTGGSSKVSAPMSVVNKQRQPVRATMRRVDASVRSPDAAPEGTVVRLKYFEEYGFLRVLHNDYYFRKSDLVDPQEWPLMTTGSIVTCGLGGGSVQGKAGRAKLVKLLYKPKSQTGTG